jgi:hypothetical protein
MSGEYYICKSCKAAFHNESGRLVKINLDNYNIMLNPGQNSFSMERLDKEGPSPPESAPRFPNK